MASLWLGPPREGLRPWVFHKEHVRTAKVKKEKVSHLLSLSDQLNKCGQRKESHLQLFPEATVLTTSTHGFPQRGASETCPPTKIPYEMMASGPHITCVLIPTSSLVLV